MPKPLPPTEYEECVAFAQYLDLRGLLFTHIAQETFTKNWGTKIKNKKMGVRKGFPDYAICHNNKLLLLEMKRKKNSRISPEQDNWLKKLAKVQGVISAVCYGADEAIKVVEEELIKNYEQN